MVPIAEKQLSLLDKIPFFFLFFMRKQVINEIALLYISYDNNANRYNILYFQYHQTNMQTFKGINLYE